MRAPTDTPGADEPVRVRLHTSLTERPFFGGVDMEFMLLAGFLLWTAFLVFKLAAPFWVVALACGVLYGLMRRANLKDQFFLPILIRSLTYRRVYAARAGATEVGPVRPSLPIKALPS